MTQEDLAKHGLTIDQAYALTQWYKGLRDTTVPAFFDLYNCKTRFLVMRGGAGSGKSIFAGRKVLERCADEPRHRMLVCRKVARTLRESCFAQLKSQAYEHYAWALERSHPINESDMGIRFRNGSEILFAGLDDVEKLKSIHEITSIWVEEASEIAEEDLNQLNLRLRPTAQWYPQIILTFNPISVTHWLKRRFFDRQDTTVTVHNSTYLDNPYLPEDYKRQLESYKELDPYYYMVYALNQWGVAGRTVFDAEAVARRMDAVQRIPVQVGQMRYAYDGMQIRDVQFAQDPLGALRVWEAPVQGRPYVLGVDTAGEGSDWQVAQVIDNITSRQVARLRCRDDEDIFTREVYALGTWYNSGMIAVEANFSTYPIMELDRLGYPHQYVREAQDTFTGEVRKAYGFKTTAISRPVILSGLIAAVRGDGIGLVNDADTLGEMVSFVRNDKLRPEAEQGAHDDTIMALAIAHYVRPQWSMQVDVQQQTGTSVWTADMWEDWRKSSREQRQYLEQKWGTPKR